MIAKLRLVHVAAHFNPECIEHVHKTLDELDLHSHGARKLNIHMYMYIA